MSKQDTGKKKRTAPEAMPTPEAIPTPEAMPPRVVDTINAYRTAGDALGSYTGVVGHSLCMPRKVVDGKIYLKVEETPVQDQDDL